MAGLFDCAMMMDGEPGSGQYMGKEGGGGGGGGGGGRDGGGARGMGRGGGEAMEGVRVAFVSTGRNTAGETVL